VLGPFPEKKVTVGMVNLIRTFWFNSWDLFLSFLCKKHSFDWYMSP